MSLILKLSWRNLRRNTRRTLITSLVMSVGLTGLIFVDGFLSGLVNTMIESATTTLLGDWEIHGVNQSGKNLSNSLESSIVDIDGIEEKLKIRRDQMVWARRIVTDGMASAAEYSNHVRIYGIDTEAEEKTSKILDSVAEGSLFGKTLNAEPEIMIGSGLAQNLNLHAGEHLVLVSSGFQNTGMIQDRFKIAGVFKSGSRQIDQFVVLMTAATAQKFFHLPEGVYQEIAIHSLVPDLRKHPELVQIDAKPNRFETWKQVLPALEAGINITSFSRMIYSIVLVFLTLLTVTNAVLMSIHERMYEMGVLKAIGTKPRQIFLMIGSETVLLSVLSAFSGVVLGLALILAFQGNGIPFGQIEYFGTSIDKGIVPLFDQVQYTLYPLLIIFIATLASIYPALYASRVNPLAALRRE